MINFIEFILSNFFFLALLIGAIISVINRQSKTGKKVERKQQEKPTFQWEDLFDPETYQKEESPSPAAPSSENTPPSEPVTSPRQTEMEAYYEQKEALERKKQQAEERLKHLNPSPLFEERQTTERGASTPSHAFTVTNKDAVQGVIWSEILGEPVAKRKFHRRKNNIS